MFVNSPNQKTQTEPNDVDPTHAVDWQLTAIDNLGTANVVVRSNSLLCVCACAECGASINACFACGHMHTSTHDACAQNRLWKLRAHAQHAAMQRRRALTRRPRQQIAKQPLPQQHKHARTHAPEYTNFENRRAYKARDRRVIYKQPTRAREAAHR